MNGLNDAIEGFVYFFVIVFLMMLMIFFIAGAFAINTVMGILTLMVIGPLGLAGICAWALWWIEQDIDDIRLKCGVLLRNWLPKKEA